MKQIFIMFQPGVLGDGAEDAHDEAVAAYLVLRVLGCEELKSALVLVLFGGCVVFELGCVSTMIMMMPSGTKLRMSGGQSGQRLSESLSMLGLMCVVTVGALWPFHLPLRAAAMPLIRGSAIW
eukprot:3066905-Rhodomonas_salina.1